MTTDINADSHTDDDDDDDDEDYTHIENTRMNDCLGRYGLYGSGLVILSLQTCQASRPKPDIQHPKVLKQNTSKAYTSVDAPRPQSPKIRSPHPSPPKAHNCIRTQGRHSSHAVLAGTLELCVFSQACPQGGWSPRGEAEKTP